MSPYVLKVISPAQLNICRSKWRNCLLCHFSKALYLLNFFLSAFLLLFTKTLQSSWEQAIKCTDVWANINKTKIRPSHKSVKVRQKNPNLVYLFSLSIGPFSLEQLRKYIYLSDHCSNKINLLFLFQKKEKTCCDGCQSSACGRNVILYFCVVTDWLKPQYVPEWTKEGTVTLLCR